MHSEIHGININPSIIVALADRFVPASILSGHDFSAAN